MSIGIFLHWWSPRLGAGEKSRLASSHGILQGMRYNLQQQQQQQQQTVGTTKFSAEGKKGKKAKGLF
jgi:hypothetical protein